jgi:hypothetical protein
MSAKVMPFNHNKSFSRELYNKHDGFAKTVAKSLLAEIGYKTINEDEAYGSHDFVVEKNGTPTKVEVEQKNAWIYEQFPFDSHRVSYRKRTSCADLFLQISKNGCYVAMCPMSVVKTSPVITTNTCLGTRDEPFFDVPASAMKYYVLEDGIWYENY